MSSPEGTRDGLGSVPAQMEDAEKRKIVQYTARRLVCVPMRCFRSQSHCEQVPDPTMAPTLARAHAVHRQRPPSARVACAPQLIGRPPTAETTGRVGAGVCDGA